MTNDLFDALRERRRLSAGADFLPGFALDTAGALLAAIETVACYAPFRRMTVPGGGVMSVGITSCGVAGWCSDERGYRYESHDPQTGGPWPAMPPIFRSVARHAADVAGFRGYEPNVCLMNRYVPGARMGLHQDRDEGRLDAPIVSISLGMPAWFVFGGCARHDPSQSLELLHGDVLVWGGPSRLAWHGVKAVRSVVHPLTGSLRYNLTFRAIVEDRFRS